jgi:hypothetical protein
LDERYPRLAPVDSATSLRQQGAELLVTDGPSAETKEIFGAVPASDTARRRLVAKRGDDLVSP